MDKKTEKSQTPEGLTAGRKFTLKVFGIGGAGGNAVDYMAQQDFCGVEFMAINTDARALGQLKLGEKMALGAKLTRGLGTGGDPEMGRAAAEEDLEKIRGLCAGADVIFVVAGMGGGTGTGAGPVVARLAKESGALVLGMVTLPFDFEGARRQRQAQLGLRDLKAAADGIICLPNQKIFKLIDENTSVDEALKHEESSLATVEAAGENRAHEIMETLMKHPFLDAGQVLSEADAVLVSLSGGPDLTMVEVNRVMEQINRQCENAHIIMGAGIHENLAGKLSVTLVASRPKAREERRPGAAAQKGMMENPDAHEKEIVNPTPTQRPASKFVAPAPELTAQQTEQFLATKQTGRSRKKGAAMQSQLPLEIVSKGRFEKSEPTIHRGEDLDVPTYIRRGMALN
jgi:cell division protein FtsZ